jgi:hypothetical protein
VPVRRLLIPALVVLAGCSTSITAEPAGTLPPPAQTTVPTTTTTTTSTTATTTTSLAPTGTTAPATSTTVAGIDPTIGDIEDEWCTSIAVGSVGYRNNTGTTADEYRRIGTSTEGRSIWAEHWGSKEGPQLLMLGQVHGDECAPAFMVQAVREVPPEGFGIWIVPTVNPDGLAAHSRRTATNTDPNRDGFDLTTPEAQAVMSFTATIQPAMTIHLHSPYKWVGAHNNAWEVATAMSTAAGWGPPNNAGRVDSGTLAFLWEGQERIIAGHPSVLVEFPSISPLEAPVVPDPSQRVEGTVGEVSIAAVLMRDALYQAILHPGAAPG